VAFFLTRARRGGTMVSETRSLLFVPVEPSLVMVFPQPRDVPLGAAPFSGPENAARRVELVRSIA